LGLGEVVRVLEEVGLGRRMLHHLRRRHRRVRHRPTLLELLLHRRLRRRLCLLLLLLELALLEQGELLVLPLLLPLGRVPAHPTRERGGGGGIEKMAVTVTMCPTA
jgi:hypothetical protein